ncbi:hypothetical protein BpHYR1_054317 [Brachionus plicatilis]|uniref:Uncharacterized protein n=1 Tax=Brachionus plicatilis TaxID=10195 RepID=A0A3M7QSF4_BRAPC|nr:hypothetical protein BpHYR1_054317 [Brachionus plicatilis]
MDSALSAFSVPIVAVSVVLSVTDSLCLVSCWIIGSVVANCELDLSFKFSIFSAFSVDDPSLDFSLILATKLLNIISLKNSPKKDRGNEKKKLLLTQDTNIISLKMAKKSQIICVNYENIYNLIELIQIISNLEKLQQNSYLI